MKIRYSGYFLFVLAVVSGQAYTTDPSEVQRIYKSIEEQLIDIRKEHPTTQQKIYTILDQVNKLSSLASSSSSKIQHLEKELKTKESEFNIIQDELVKSKKSAQETEDKIKTLATNFEQEKKLSQQLAQEKKKTEQLAAQKRDLNQEHSIKNMFQLAHSDEQQMQQTQQAQQAQQIQQPQQEILEQNKNTPKSNQELLRMLDDRKLPEK